MPLGKARLNLPPFQSVGFAKQSGASSARSGMTKRSARDSTEGAAIWGRRVLPAKNSLNAVDARQLEDAFQARLAELNERARDNENPSAANNSNLLRHSNTTANRP